MKIAPLLLSALVLCLSGNRGFADDEDSLPPRIVVGSAEEAIKLAGADFFPVKGTGSMKPYIPEHPDPEKIVAILAIDKPPYEELKEGDLVIYQAGDKQVVHQIAAAQGDKWITSGLNNDRYDGPALDRETFVSRVLRVYIIGPEEPAKDETDSARKVAEK